MTDPLAPDRQLAVDYARANMRPGFAALLALDAKLAGIVHSTSEPMIGQLRLAWWREALERLDVAPAPAEPLLRDLKTRVLPGGVAGADLATLVEGWEALIDPADAAAIAIHAEQRGGRFFRLAARLMGEGPATLDAAGKGWALADLAVHAPSRTIAEDAGAAARAALTQAFSECWPRSSRPLGALALFEQLRIEGQGALAAFLRMTRFRMTGS